MAFAGTMGAAAALLPFGIIRNILGETSPGYDADGNITFTRASGQVYTPERVDTLIITGAAADAVPPLGALVAGATNIANADAGQLTTAAAGANQHGLPANFGPGRGNWADPTGVQRLSGECYSELTVVSVTLAGGSVQCVGVASGGNATLTCRNFHGENLTGLVIRVECVHSVQS